MYFATFYNISPVNGKINEACGDRSVLLLDGRESTIRHRAHATQWAEKHNFVGFRLCKGESFNRVQIEGKLILIGT